MLAWHTLQTRGPTWRQLEGKNSFRGNSAKGKVVSFDFRSTLNRWLICLENEPAHLYLTHKIDVKSCCDPSGREKGARTRSSFMCPEVSSAHQSSQITNNTDRLKQMGRRSWWASALLCSLLSGHQHSDRKAAREERAYFVLHFSVSPSLGEVRQKHKAGTEAKTTEE